MGAQSQITPQDISEYRLYLRHNYYSKYIGELQEILYQTISAINAVQVNDDTNITLKVRKRKETLRSIDISNEVSTALNTLYDNCHLDSALYSDQTIDQITKQKYMNIHQMVSNGLVSLYNVVVLDQNTACVYL